jgi:hypothetical protein
LNKLLDSTSLRKSTVCRILLGLLGEHAAPTAWNLEVTIILLHLLFSIGKLFLILPHVFADHMSSIKSR